MAVPPLKPLHRDDQLIKGKLEKYEKATTEELIESLRPGKAGSLTADQYWAILAFDLHANGIDLPAPLTPDQAKTLTIPR